MDELVAQLSVGLHNRVKNFKTVSWPFYGCSILCSNRFTASGDVFMGCWLHIQT